MITVDPYDPCPSSIFLLGVPTPEERWTHTGSLPTLVTAQGASETRSVKERHQVGPDQSRLGKIWGLQKRGRRQRSPRRWVVVRDRRRPRTVRRVRRVDLGSLTRLLSGGLGTRTSREECQWLEDGSGLKRRLPHARTVERRSS